MKNKEELIKRFEEFNSEAEPLFKLSFQGKLQGSGVKFSWSREDKKFRSEFRGPDDESIKAYCNDLRKFIQKNDSLKIEKLTPFYQSNLVTQKNKKFFGKQMSEINKFLKSSTNHTINGKTYTNQEILEIFLYGKISHRTEGQKEIHDALEKSPLYLSLKNIFVTILYIYLVLINNLVFINKEVLKELDEANANKIEWKEVELKEIAQFINGRAFKPSDWEHNGKLIIRIQDLTGSITNPNYTTKTFEEKYLIKKGDLLISWSATLDAFIWGKEEGWLNQHIFKVVPDKKFVDKIYLYYFVKQTINLFLNETHGSTMKHITKGRFESIKILLPFSEGKPDIREQERAVKIFEESEKLNERGKRAEELLDEYLKSIFYEMFYNKGFEYVNIGDDKICLIRGEYGSGASAIKYDGKTRYIRITDITENGTLKNEKVSPSKVEKKYLLQKGDLLFARSGATVGKTYLHNSDKINYQYAGYLIRYRFNDKIVPEYVYYFTKTPLYWAWVNSKQKVVAQPNINAKQYSSLKIPLPPLPLQQKFASIVEQIEKMKDSVNKTKQNSEELFNSLVSKGFRGEL